MLLHSLFVSSREAQTLNHPLLHPRFVFLCECLLFFVRGVAALLLYYALPGSARPATPAAVTRVMQNKCTYCETNGWIRDIGTTPCTRDFECVPYEIQAIMAAHRFLPQTLLDYAGYEGVDRAVWTAAAGDAYSSRGCC